MLGADSISDSSVDAGTSQAVSIVVPIYNSQESLAELVEEIAEAFRASPRPLEMILVDDGSRDDSWSVISEIARTSSWVHGVRLMRNFGQHNALLAGIRAANHDIIVTMDDDLQHRPDQIHELLGALQDGVDLVYGIPQAEEHGWMRSFASEITKVALARTMHSPAARNVSAFRAFRRVLRDGFAGNTDPRVTLDVLLSWSTSHIRAITVRMDPRRYGTSNYTWRRLLRHAVNMITGYSTAPLRFVTYLGMGFSAFGWLVLMFVLIRYAVGGGGVPGFTFLAALTAVFSGAQMLALGILGEYLARMHFRSMSQPQYVVRETTLCHQ